MLICCFGVSFDIIECKFVDFCQIVLLEFGDVVCDLIDFVEIVYWVVEIFGWVLQVSWVGYGVIDKVVEMIIVECDWNVFGIIMIVGMLYFCEYGLYIEDLKVGWMVVILDVDCDYCIVYVVYVFKLISVWLFINMLLVEQDDFVVLIYVNYEVLRIWVDDEIMLMCDVVECVCVVIEWFCVEVVLCESEEQFCVFVQVMFNYIWVVCFDGYLYWFNQQVFVYIGVVFEVIEGFKGWFVFFYFDDGVLVDECWW